MQLRYLISLSCFNASSTTPTNQVRPHVSKLTSAVIGVSCSMTTITFLHYKKSNCYTRANRYKWVQFLWNLVYISSGRFDQVEPSPMHMAHLSTHLWDCNRNPLSHQLSLVGFVAWCLGIFQDTPKVQSMNRTAKSKPPNLWVNIWFLWCWGPHDG